MIDGSKAVQDRLTTVLGDAPDGRTESLCWRDNEAMAPDAELLRISLAPDPVVEAYKKDIDRTSIRENLTLSVEDRVQKMLSALRLAVELRRGGATPR